MSRNEYECPECSQFLTWIADYVDGELDQEVRHELMMHVHSCEHCARMLWSMERLVGYCRTEPGWEMPTQVREQFWQVIVREIRSGQEGIGG